MKYDDRFRKEAVRLSLEIGVGEAAKKLGIPYYTLAEWRKNRSNHLIKEGLRRDEEIKKMNSAELQNLIEQLQEENSRLTKEKREVEEANEIFKDALGFLSKTERKSKCFRYLQAEVTSKIYHYVFAYYNTIRINTFNLGGLPPMVYRELYYKNNLRQLTA